MQGVRNAAVNLKFFNSPKRACGVRGPKELAALGVFAVLLKGLEVLRRARAVNSDQEKPVLGDTCCRLA